MNILYDKLIMNYWLVKSEPADYSWRNLVKESRAVWNGVRNYQARNNLRNMKRGDLVLFYHSNEGKEVVGIAKVVRESYPDPTTDDARWAVIDLSPFKPLRNPVKLSRIKLEKELQNMALVKHSRLSVMPVTAPEFERILEMGSSNILNIL